MVVSLIPSLVFAQTQPEQLTITTYYPSPYGSYRDLTTYQMKIGSGAAYTGSGGFLPNSLIIEGSLAIGAATIPTSTAPKLYIGNGNVEATGFYAFETNGANAFMERGTDNDGVVLFGGWNSATSSFTTTQIDGSTLILQGRSGGGVTIGNALTQATPGMLVVNGGASKTNGGTTWVDLSDARYKDIVGGVNNALATVSKLKPIRYKWNKLRIQKYGGNEKEIMYGFTAQNVKEAIPEFITEDKEGYLWYNPSGYEAVLTKAIQELKAENDALKQRVQALEKAVGKQSKK